MMNNKLMTTEFGMMELGEVDTYNMSLCEEFLQVFIDVSSIPEKLQQKLAELIEEAKAKKLEEFKEIYSRKGLQWSKAGVEVICMSLSVVLYADKKMETALSTYFIDKEDELMEADTGLDIDLSASAEQLKSIILETITERYFK